MSNEHIIGIRLTADGKELVGEVRLSGEELKKLAKATRDAGSEAERLNASNKSVAASFGGISSIVKTVAASYAVLKAAQYAQEAALLSARYETLGVSMQVVGNNAGYTASEMEAAAVGMQKTGISMIESRQQALRLVQANISLSESNKLARIAQDAAVIGNINSSEAFAKMIHGIQTGQTDVLRSIGLNISMEQSYAAYAATLGKSANALTQAEKTQAVLNAVMKEGAAIAGTYEAAMGTAGKQLNSLARYHDNLKVVVGGTFTEALAAAVGAYTGELKNLNDAAMELKVQGDLKAWGRASALVMAGVADSARMVFNTVGAMASVVERLTVTAAIWANPFASGVPRLRALQDDLKKQQAEFVAGMSDNLKVSDAVSAMFDSIDARAKESADKRLSIEKDYVAKAQVVAAAYSGTAHQISALRALADSFGGDIKAEHGSPKLLDMADATGKLKSATGDYIAALEKETAAIGKNVYEKKYLEAAAKSQAAATQAQREEIMRVFAAWSLDTQAEEANTVAKEANEEATKAATKAAEEMNKVYFDSLDALNQSTAGIVDDTQKLRDQNIELTYGKDALEQVKKAREQATIATLQATLAGIDETDQCSAEAEAIRGKIAALEDYAAAQGANVVAKQVEEEGKLRVDMWKKVDDVGRDTFVNIWGHGKSTLDRLRDTLKNGLLAMLYEMGKKQFLISVGVAGAGLGASGVASAGSDLLGMASTGSSIAGFGSAVATGWGLTAEAATAAAAAYSSAGMAATSFGLQLGNMAAAIPGWGWAIAGGLAAVGLFEGTPTSSTGDASMNFSATGAMTGRNAMGNYAALAADAADAFVVKMNEGYLAAAKNLGLTAAATTFAFAANTGKDGKQPNFGIGGGVAGGTYYNSAETATSDAAVMLEQSRVMFQALKDSVGESSQYLLAAFSQISNIGAASQQQIDAAMGFATALHQTRAALTETRTPLEILTQTVSTGMATLGTSAETFKNDFVDAIDTGTLTPELLADWASLGNGLEQLEVASAQAAAGIAQSIANMANSLASLGNTGFGADLANATAATTMAAVTAAMPWITSIGQLATITAADAAQYAANDTANNTNNVALMADAIAAAAQAQQYANQPVYQPAPSYDYQPAPSYSAAPDNSAQLAIDQERANLQSQLNALTDTATQALTRQRDALDESNRALFDQIQGVKDSAAASAEAARAAEEAAAKSAALAQTNLGIQQQIDVLNKVQTQRQVDLANALDGADASTAALISQLFGLQDAASAAAEAQAAAQENLSATKSDLLEAYNRESSAAQQLADRMTGFATGFNKLRASLALGALSTLSPEAKYLEAQRQFDDVTRRAKLGDVAAMEELQGVSQSFLQASRDYNASSEAYAADFAKVNDALLTSAAVAERQANIQLQQVSLMQSQLSALGLINTSVMSVASALAAYQAAGGGSAAQATSYTAPTAAAIAAAPAAAAATTAAMSTYGQSYGGDAYYLIPGVTDYAAKLESATDISKIIGMSVADVFALQGHSQEYWQEVQKQWDAGLHPTTSSVPGFAVGTNYVPHDMTANIHEGERIIPAADNRALMQMISGGGGDRETNKLLKEVVNELRGVVIELRADKTQRGAVGSAMMNKLEVVADKLDGNKREIARSA